MQLARLVKAIGNLLQEILRHSGRLYPDFANKALETCTECLSGAKLLISAIALRLFESLVKILSKSKC